MGLAFLLAILGGLFILAGLFTMSTAGDSMGNEFALALGVAVLILAGTAALLSLMARRSRRDQDGDDVQ